MSQADGICTDCQDYSFACWMVACPQAGERFERIDQEIDEEEER